MKKIFFLIILFMGIINTTFATKPEPMIGEIFTTATKLFDAEITLGEAIINLSQMSRQLFHTPFYQPIENIIDSLLGIFEDRLTFEEAEIIIEQELATIEQQC